MSEQPTDLAPTSEANGPTALLDPIAPAPDAREQLRHYMRTFGDDDGAKYFSEGMTLNDAALFHLEVLNERMQAIKADAEARIAKAEAEAAAALDRLASMNTGEEMPVDTGKPKSRAEGGGSFDSLFKQAAGPTS